MADILDTVVIMVQEWYLSFDAGGYNMVVMVRRDSPIFCPDMSFEEYLKYIVPDILADQDSHV